MRRIDTTGWGRMGFVDFYTKVWGLPVIPILENKKPVVKWAEYQERQPTQQELDNWFVKQKAWGLAIILKGGLFSLDMDTDELYKDLKAMGAFPEGTCIYKSKKGYHTILRATGKLYSIAEHNEGLPQEFQELGIGGDRHLSNMPDTPDRYWINLYDEPASVNFERWVKRYIGEPKETKGAKAGRGGGSEWIAILCPWHEFDGKPHQPSCNVDLIGRGYKCWGCGKQGKLSELVAYCRKIGYQLPEEISTADKSCHPSLGINMPEKILYGVDEEVKEEELPAALIEGVAWRGDVGELYGIPGSGKSSLMTSGVADLMLGRDFWGDWKVTKPCKVLYLNLENPKGETALAIQAALGKGMKIPKGSQIAELVGVGFDISDPKWVGWLDKEISRHRFDVVIGDNLGKMTGKNIIDDYEMKQVVNTIRSLTRKHNILFLLIHHTGWERYDNKGRALPAHGKGGSSLQEDVNFCFEVVRVRKDTPRITVKKIRSRRAGITVGDELVHYYDHETMRIVPTELKATMLQAKWLIDKYSVQGAADKIGCSRQAMGNYAHGFRQPAEEFRDRLKEVVKAEGYAPHLTDIQ